MKKIIAALISTTLIIALTACGSKEERKIHKYSPGQSQICIYYPGDNEIVCKEEKYQLKQPDSVNASVEEVMSILTENIIDDIEYKTYMISEKGELSLEFQQVGECNAEMLLITKAAVVKTLLQINNIRTIIIELTDMDGNIITVSEYDGDSFFFYDYSPELALNSTSIRLYYQNESGNKLTSAYYSFNNEINVSVPEQVINALVNYGYLPKDVKVEKLNINSGICYLKLNESFKKKLNGINGELLLFSLVNSLTSIPSIDAVKLSFESGDDILVGINDISKPLYMNVDIVE